MRNLRRGFLTTLVHFFGGWPQTQSNFHCMQQCFSWWSILWTFYVFEYTHAKSWWWLFKLHQSLTFHLDNVNCTLGMIDLIIWTNVSPLTLTNFNNNYLSTHSFDYEINAHWIIKELKLIFSWAVPLLIRPRLPESCQRKPSVFSFLAWKS